MITHTNSLGDIQLRLDGKVVGRIIKTKGGFAYKPKGTSKFRSKTFKDIEDCKKSLES